MVLSRDFGPIFKLRTKQIPGCSLDLTFWATTIISDGITLTINWASSPPVLNRLRKDLF